MIIAHRKQGKSATVQKAPPPVQEVDLVSVTGYQKCRQMSTGSGDHWVINVISLAVGAEPAESNAGTLSLYVSVYTLCLFACRRQHCSCEESPTAHCPLFLYPLSSINLFSKFLEPPNPSTHLVRSLRIFFLMIIKIPQLFVHCNSCGDRYSLSLCLPLFLRFSLRL